MAENNISGLNPTGTPTSLDVMNAGMNAISFKEQLPDLAQKLRDALMTKFASNPLYSARETAMQGFMNAGPEARADISSMQKDTGVPLSPTQQQSILSAKRSAAYAPLMTSSNMLSATQGGMEDIVSSGTRAFEAAATAQGERANLLKELRQQELDRQFKEQGIALDWAKLNTSEAKENKKVIKDLTDQSQGIDDLITKIGDVRNLIRSGKTSTGFLQNLKFGLQRGGLIPSWLGGTPSSEQSKLSTSVSDLNTRLFDVAGKAFTGPEKELLQGLIVSMATTPEYIEQQLTQMESIANRKRDDLIRQFLLTE